MTDRDERSGFLADKYDSLAPSWSDHAYADHGLVYRRRAEVVGSLGGPLPRGAQILELGCADGGLSAELVAGGFQVEGVDMSPGMIERARAYVPDATFAVGNLNEYAPALPVAATIGFRILTYVDDLAAFFARVASFSTEKVIFDFSPSSGPTLETVRAALREAGLDRVEERPWLLPARTHVPRAAVRAVSAVERVRPLAMAITRVRFAVVVAAKTG